MKIEIKVRPTEISGQWELLETFYWGNLLIPKGQLTDGASIPWFLRKLLPKYGKLFGPAVIHDTLYRNTIGARKEADGIFLAAMLSNGLPRWKSYLMYYGVRIFGRFCYGKEN